MAKLSYSAKEYYHLFKHRISLEGLTLNLNARFRTRDYKPQSTIAASSKHLALFCTARTINGWKLYFESISDLSF